MTEQGATEPRLPEAPYAFRPAKRIQRLMFTDALRALRFLHPLEEYQYIGFGHWQFVDFELMRREVGIREMYSIERNTSAKERFEENNPFEEVHLLFDTAFSCLQSGEIDLSKPTIAWLDYTSKLDSSALQDLLLLAEKVPPGSVIAATFNCHPDREDQRLDALERTVGEVPGDVGEDDLDRDGLPRVQQRILVEKLDETAQKRKDGTSIKQFMFLRYKDRSPMAFWAGLLGDESDKIDATIQMLARCEQFRDDQDFFDISVPHLSTREVIALNKDIKEGSLPFVRGVPKEQCEAYGRLHRWYPPVPLPL